MKKDKRIFAPAAARNRTHIFDCLQGRLPQNGTLLEVASGSGEHAAYLAPLFPRLRWQPTNLDQTQLDSVNAWRTETDADNLLPALRLNATDMIWPVEQDNYEYGSISAIFNANMIHISPWQVCQGLMAGAGRVLPKGGSLHLYGPFKISGEHTADSNIVFEKWLTDQNTEFGVRDIEDVTKEANKHGLEHVESCPMPANNFIQIFRKTT